MTEEKAPYIATSGELTTTFEVSTVGRQDEIEARSFQVAAQKMLEKLNFKSVASILVDDMQNGAIEFLECEIVDGNLVYRDHDVHNLHDADSETLERLNFYALPSNAVHNRTWRIEKGPWRPAYDGE